MVAQPVPAIRVQGLQKSFKQLHVLRGVDFNGARGSIVAIVLCA
jgi:ABC-2 type transport system ATP-binding protein